MPNRPRDTAEAGWEPVPWNAGPAEVSRQKQGFGLRSGWPIVWQMIPWRAFPADGVLGCDKDDLIRAEAVAHAIQDSEDLLLVQRDWSGWPDPPEWGLASRPAGHHKAPWQDWGGFPQLPSAWQVPDGIA